MIGSLALLPPLLAASAPLLPGPQDAVGLRPVWTRDLGPAYSRVAVRGDTVVTQYADGEHDLVVALDAADGAPRWRHVLGPRYLGHDGSEDGPISTPVIGDGAVYALDPRGQLVALDRASGELRWSVHLVEDLGAEAPEYGYATSPVLVGDVLVVQAGGSEGRSLVGLDAATGALRWSLGEGEAAYQSPALLELAGRRQLVVLNGQELQGVDPGSGALLWEHALGERANAGTGRAGAIDGERFHVYVSGQLAVFLVTAEGEGYAVEELYRTRELGGTYAQPVHHAGYLYGYRSSFLTCVDVETGRRVWKSRPPGGAGLVRAGEHLAVFGAEGVVALVRATPEGYDEVARVQALEHSGYAWPTLADGRVYVRNSAGLACLALDGAAPPVAAAPPAPEEVLGPHAFGAFLDGLAEVDDPQARVEAYLAEQPGFPILEGDLVHLVYRGEADDVAVVGSMTGGSRAEPLTPVPGTDLFHRSYRIEPGARWLYQFQVDFDRTLPDPLNPRSVPGRRGQVSELVTPGFEPAAHQGEPAEPRGHLVGFQYESEQLENTRPLQVYLPVGYEEGDARYPLVLVHDAPEALGEGRLARSLDNLIGRSVRPVVVVFVSPIQEWWFEAGGSYTEEYLRMLATELVPHLEQRYRLSSDPADRALVGVRGFGLTALLGAVAHPDVFGKAGAQSVSLEDVARHVFFERLAAAPPREARFYLDWNRYEAYDADRGYDYGEYGPRVAAALDAAGCRWVGGEALDCHGWPSWSARTDRWLEAFFPLE